MGTFLYGSGHLTVSRAIAMAAGTLEGVLDGEGRDEGSVDCDGSAESSALTCTSHTGS